MANGSGAALPMWCEQEHRVAWEDKWTRIHTARADAEKGLALLGNQQQAWLDHKGRNHWLSNYLLDDNDGHVARADAALEAWGRWERDRASTGAAECIHGPVDVSEQRRRYAETLSSRADTDWLIEREVRTKEVLQLQLAQLRGEVNALDQQLESMGERRRLAARLWHDASIHSEHERSGYIVVQNQVLRRTLTAGLAANDKGEYKGWRGPVATPHRSAYNSRGCHDSPSAVHRDYHLSLSADMRGLMIQPVHSENSLMQRRRTDPYASSQLSPLLGVIFTADGNGGAELRAGQPLLEVRWVQQTIADVLRLRRRRSNDSSQLDSSDTSMARHTRNDEADEAVRFAEVERIWDCDRPRWLLRWTSTAQSATEGGPGWLCFSSDAVAPAVLALSYLDHEAAAAAAVAAAAAEDRAIGHRSAGGDAIAASSGRIVAGGIAKMLFLGPGHQDLRTERLYGL